MRTKFAFISALFLLFVGQVVFAQVTGTVQDGDGFPISDAEVKVRGSETTTSTDENGLFSIDAKVGDVLVISDPMGTTQDFSVTANRMGTLKLGSAVELDVVTITSVFDASSLSEAGVTVIGAEDLETLPPSLSVDQMLSGKVPGLHSVAQAGGAPGGVANVVVRGSMSLNGGVKSPLYVVNGAYMDEADVNSINPNDIETITVLKEAAQLAVYGSRGANGVVIIKTKTAKKGQSSISYRAMVGFSEMMPLNDFKTMGSAELLNFENQISALTNPVTGASLNLGMARTPEEIAELSQINTDWEDEFLKTGFQTSHYVAINTGTENVSNNFSIGYDSNNGNVMYYKGFERISVTLGRSVNVNESFRYGLNLSGAYTKRDNPRDRYNGQNAFWGILKNRPYATLYDLDAEGNPVLDDFGDPVFNEHVANFTYAALDEMKYSTRWYKNFRMFGSAFAELDIFKNVTARTAFGGTYDHTMDESFLQPRAILNGYLEFPDTPGTKWDNWSNKLDYNWRNEITYKNRWGDHNFSATIASEYIQERFRHMYIESIGFPNNYQSDHNIAFAIQDDLNDKNLGTRSARWQITRFGYLGSLSYDFANKYFVNGYARRDGTSLAGLDNQYGWFWGASLGWDIAKEGFAVGSSWLDTMLLRASYGEVGDDSALELYSNLTTQTILPSGSWPNLLVANPEVTWEVNKKMNLGLQFGLFNNRLTGNVDAFQDRRSDFLFEDVFSSEGGQYSTYVNAGEIVNKGLEVDLNYDVLRAKEGLNVSLYANLTYIDYEVTKLSGDNERIFPANTFESHVHRLDGEPWEFFMVRFAGVDPANGDALYYDIDGNVTNVYNAADAVALEGKSPLPEFYGGFGLNAEYKGFELTAGFNYQYGAYMYNNTYFDLTNLTSGTNGDNKHVDAANYWQNPGDTNVFQRPDALGFQYSDQFLEKNDYILFRDLTLGYNVNKRVLENTPVKAVKITAQVQNIALWTNFHGTPIVGTGSSESSGLNTEGYISGSFSAYSYPLSRAFLLGLNVTF